MCYFFFRNEFIFQAVFGTCLWCINKTCDDITIKISRVFIVYEHWCVVHLGPVNHTAQSGTTIMTTTRRRICCYGDRKEVRFVWISCCKANQQKWMKPKCCTRWIWMKWPVSLAFHSLKIFIHALSSERSIFYGY